MSTSGKISRRQFIKLIGTTGAVVAACAGPAATTAPVATTGPTLATPRKVRIAVGAWAEGNERAS